MNFKYITETSEVERLLPVLMSKPSWGTDSETTGLDPHVNKVVLAQFGRPDEQYVVDTRKASIEPLRPFLESREILKIGHNLKFDYKMFRGTFDIEMEGLRDTYMGHKTLTAGRRFYKYGNGGLDDVLKARMGIEMDKELQKSFIGHTGEFSQAQLQYAADDVKHLLPLCQGMVDEMRPLDLLRTFKLESEAVAAFGDMEYEGMLIDTVAWRGLMEKHKKLAEETRQAMDAFAEAFVGKDLFGQVDVNYGSPPQMVKLLNLMRLKVKVYDRATRTEKIMPVTDTSKETLKKLRDIPFIKLLEKWRSYQIRINTFGQPYIDAIHPKTGRIHPDLWQYGTDTGRPAAGDSDVNPLNIPRENEFRHCFICYEDEVVESDDFSGCESRILAEISGDPRLIEIFLKGEDIHCSVATELYGKLVTKDNENKKLRTPAKSLNFGIAYGMGPNKLYDDLNGQGFPVTRDEAKQLYYRYCEKYATAVNFLRDAGKSAAKQGYLANLNGRRRYWDLPDPTAYSGGYRNPEYQGRIGAIEREGGNFMIQSVNADMTKQAMIWTRDYRKKNKVRTSFVNAVYDELVTRTHKDDSPTFHKEKLKMMQQAGEQWIKKVPMLVDGAVHPYWTK